jgi:hypothetical protein
MKGPQFFVDGVSVNFPEDSIRVIGWEVCVCLDGGCDVLQGLKEVLFSGCGVCCASLAGLPEMLADFIHVVEPHVEGVVVGASIVEGSV